MPAPDKPEHPEPTATPEESTVEYRLDRSDRIVDVNPQWNAFAESNGAPNLTAEAIIGRPLRDFITGDVTRMFVDTLLQGTRLLGRPRSVQYRCDSVDAKRYMTMEIEPLADGGIISRHQIVRQEKFAAPFGFRAGQGGQRALVKRCSMCNRLSRDNQLLEPDDAKAAGWLSDGASTMVIYFICRDCQTLVRNQRHSR